MYRFTEGGLRNVWLANGYIEHTTKYGKGISIHDVDGLTVAICKALVKKPSKLTGAEFRYIRNSMHLSQVSLGKQLGYTEQAVAKWEKSGKIPKAVEYFLRSICMARHNGNVKVCAMIDTVNFLDRISSTKIIISEARNQWVSKFEDESNQSSILAA